MSAKTAISPRFVQRVAANLAYWQMEAMRLEDTTLAEFATERQNLFRAVDYGLRLPETQSEAVQLVDALFPLVERRGYWAEWIPILQQAIATTDAPCLQAKLTNQCGMMHRFLSQIEQTIAAHEQAVALARQHNCLEELGRAYFYLGNVYHFDKRQYHRAQTFVEKARETFAQAGLGEDPIKQGATLNLLGLTVAGQGKYAEAQALYRRAIAYWEKSSQILFLARTWNNLGMAYSQAHQFAEALDCYDQADAILDQSPNDFDRIQIANNRAVVYYDQEKYAEAVEIILRINVAPLQQSGDLITEARLYSNAGGAYMHLGNLEQAEAYLRAAIELWQQAGDQGELAYSLGLLAETAVARGDVVTARSLLTEAVALLAQFPEDAWLQDVRQSLQNHLDDLS